MACNVINAETVNKQNKQEHEEVMIYAFVNIVFSCFKKEDSCINAECKKSLKDDSINYICLNTQEYVKSKLVYHKDVDLSDIEEAKVISKEIVIDCNHLHFDDNGNCLEFLEEYYLSLLACNELRVFLEVILPQSSKLKVYINLMGFDILNDLPFITGFLIDNNVTIDFIDESLYDFLLDNYQPVFLDFIYNGCEFVVTSIHTQELGLLTTLTTDTCNPKILPVPTSDHHMQDGQKLDSQNKIENNNVQPTVINSNIQNISNEYCNLEIDHPLSMEDGICRTDRTQPLLLEGRIETNVEYSDSEVEPSGLDVFLKSIKAVGTATNYLHKFVPPFCFLRLLGGEKIDKDAMDILVSYYKGDMESTNRLWKQLGVDVLNYTHNSLSALSFVPALGAVPAVIDGWIYTFEATYHANNLDYSSMEKAQRNALISYASAIPFFKWAKYGRSIIKAGNEVFKTATAIEKGVKSRKAILEIKKISDNLWREKGKKTINQRIQKNQLKRMLKDIESQLQELRNNKEYKKILDDYGITSNDIRTILVNQLPKVSSLRAVEIISGKKSVPVLGVLQNFTFDIVRDFVTHDSFIRQSVNNVSNNYCGNTHNNYGCY